MRIELYERPVAAAEVFKGLTSTQKANLRKLADYLKALPVDYDDFDMTTFHRPKSGVSECGSVACALGHGPLAGIGEVLPPGEISLFDWYAYALTYFGVEGRGSMDSCAIWFWLFDYTWWAVDDTPHGAAARIEWLLKFGGVPADARAQYHFLSDLSYKIIED